MTSRPPLTFQICKTQRAPIYWKGLRSLGLFNEGTQDQGNQPRRMSSSSPSCGRRAPYFDGRDFFFFWSRLWLLINSPWQWAASLCLGGHCLSYYILFFHLDSIIIKKILSGVISATNTEVIHLFHHPFCWLLRLSEKESILETQSSPREVQWLAQGHTAS